MNHLQLTISSNHIFLPINTQCLLAMLFIQQQFQSSAVGSSFTTDNHHNNSHNYHNAPTSATTFRDLSRACQSPEEYQLLCNIIELLSNLRRVIHMKPTTTTGTTNNQSNPSMGGLPGDETGRRALRFGLQIILGCMRGTSDKVGSHG